MNPSPTLVLRTVVVLALVLVVQTSILAENVVAGVHLDAFLALALAGGIVGGPDRGAVIGFCAGLLLDLLVRTPFGLSALTYSLVGYGVGALAGLQIRQSRWVPAGIAVLGGLAGVMGFAVLGELVGQPYLSHPELLRVVLVQGLGAAVLAAPCALLLRWAWRAEDDARMVLA